jgi:hypothetical protein
LIGAVISALFVPVGAVRFVIGSSSPQSAVDTWGPADVFVIAAAIAGAISLVLFIRSARAQRASAAHSAQVLLRQGNPGVSQNQIASTLGSIHRFDEWARTTGITPISANPVAVKASGEGARLIFARSTHGTPALWTPRFGDSLSRAFRATRIQARIGSVLVMGAVTIDAVGVIASAILEREGHPRAIADLLGSQMILVVVFVIGWVFILVARYAPRGLNAILDAMVPVLAVRDPKVTRAMVGAMFARPYMYDLWTLKHPAA